MPSTGSRSWRSLTAQIVPPWASVWCTARSRPSSRRSICVPSSGQAPPSLPTRPQAGPSQASWSTPSWKSSRLTRPSEAASSVGPQPAEARALRPASSFQRSTASVSCSPRHDPSAPLPPAPRLEERLDQPEQLGRSRVGVRARPADDRLARVVRELVLELGPRLLGGDHDQARPAQPTDLPVDLLCDLLQMVEHELLDVPLVARLRPAAL